jgi:fatty-acyl-CoA synthase
MRGLMQDVPLTVDLLLRRAAQVGGHKPVTSVQADGVAARHSWTEIFDRVRLLAGAFDALELSPNARVGTFAWNSHRHLELYFAVPCSGRVLHAANVRLHPDQVAYVVDHAADEVLFVDASLTEILAPVKPQLTSVREFIVMEDGGHVHEAFEDCPRYEELLSAATPGALGRAEENRAASICFTSGTTGNPKAVVYSHRSIALHSMGAMCGDSHAVGRDDVVLPLTPMFHVNAWGLPYTTAFAPAALVLAGRDTSPEAVRRLIAAERVTVAAGIPTFWIQMEESLERWPEDFESLRAILVGGAEAPPGLINRYTRRGIDFMHAWGMTEMSPSGTAAWIKGGTELAEDKPVRQGVPVPGVELRLVGEGGELLPWDGASVGELQARGPWIAAAYLDPEDGSNDERFDDGWLRTGDIARIDPDASVEIVDRAKDLIKSGGEWVSSLELERAMLEHASVLEAAIVAIPHERWGERPAALVVPAPGEELVPDALIAFLRDRVASWWVPDVIELVDELPKTAVGKYDKKRLRAELAPRLAARAAESSGEQRQP